ncbi:hypothetical protein [Microbacterium sp. NPDC076911]|uniref:hypothetical protein n=1 Tax=Microbacterium sp. NPDC076911 TaxID=3154958 RepID=UPI00343613ED
MPISSRVALAQLNNSRSVTNGVVSASLMAVMTLIEPRRLTTVGRLFYRLSMAVLTAWGVWVVLRSDDDGTLPAAARAGVTVGAAGATLGIAEAGEALDARLSDSLVRAGATRPRAILAVGAAAVSLASWWVARTRPETTQQECFDEGAAEQQVDVSDEVRAIVSQLLMVSNEFGAPELRAQLASARASVYQGSQLGAFWPGVGFRVPADLPLAVPGDATFPVIGRYRALGDRTFDVYLVVQEGRLATLAISEARDWTDEELESWMDADHGLQELGSWPSVDELDLLIETAEGYQLATALAAETNP